MPPPVTVNVDGKLLTVITELPLIVRVQKDTLLVAITVYVPPVVSTPKSKAAPVPDTGLPTNEAPLYNWYSTPDCEPDKPTATPALPTQ